MTRRFGWKPSLAIFVAVTAVYAVGAWDRLAEPSPQFHFVDLAHSFMDGRLDTDTPKQRKRSPKADDPAGYAEALARTIDSGGWNDWAQIRTLTLRDGQVLHGRFPYDDLPHTDERRHLFWTHDGLEMKVVVPRDLARTCGDNQRGLCDERHYYVSFPPFPGVVMMPLAAVLGYDVNDVVVTLVFGAANAVLLFWLLQLLAIRGHSERTTRENVVFTLLFAFGTVAFFSSIRGEVWFTALVFGVTLNLLFMLAALDLKHPVLAGIALACGMATRTPLAFCFVFFAWQLFFPANKWRGDRWREILTKGAMFAAPVAVGGVLLMLYNKARFHDSFEFGHAYLSGGAGTRIREHGLFNLYYLNLNLQHALINLPRIDFGSAHPFAISKHGLGLLVTTPVLFLLIRPLKAPPLRRALWVAVAAAAIPGLLYQNTGWAQFSYRFALDYFPYLMALLAIGGRPLTWRVWVLVGLSIAINFFGAASFDRVPSLYF